MTFFQQALVLHQSKADLLSIAKVDHGEKSKSSCPQCGLMMSPKALNCHITLVHKTDKVPCDECNDSFVSSKSLDKHKNIKHNGNIIIVKTSK